MNFDLDDLFRWIDDHEITRQKKNLNRDFSDAVPLAEILKKHYPKLVELHNYVPRNALHQKLVNWEILNKKVYKIIITKCIQFYNIYRPRQVKLICIVCFICRF